MRRIVRGYAPNRSPLYRLESKKKLAQLLGFEQPRLRALTSDEHYRVFINEKKREIQHPVGDLEKVHKAVARLLSRLVPPAYLFSAKGNSYVSNAMQHLGDEPLIKTDISKYYPNTLKSRVFGFFRDRLNCSSDVSDLLAELLTYGGHLPTGSPVSGYLAFWINKPIFDQLELLADAEGLIFTVYVDDIVLSGRGASPRQLWRIRRLLLSYGLKTKQSKSRWYRSGAPKAVTGAIVSGSKLLLPNARYLRIHELRRQLKVPLSRRERADVMLKLRSRTTEAQQVLGTA